MKEQLASAHASLVFLCGFPSSGTDLLKNVMNAHSGVNIRGEFPFLPGLADRFEAVVPAERAAEVVSALINIDVYKNLSRTCIELPKGPKQYELAALYAEMLSNTPCKWTGNKTPQNTENIAKLHHMFPLAKFVLIVRDIRDVALSWSKKWGRHKPSCAHKWNSRMQHGIAALNDLGEGSYIIVKYEDLIADLEPVAKRLCEFLDIEFDAAMLNYHASVRQTIEGKLNYGKPLIRENTNKWRLELTSGQTQRIEEIGFPTLEMFNYPIELATQPRPLSGIEKWIGRFWDACAIVIVGNRAIEENRFRHRCKTLILEFRKLISRGKAGRS